MMMMMMNDNHHHHLLNLTPVNQTTNDDGLDPVPTDQQQGRQKQCGLGQKQGEGGGKTMRRQGEASGPYHFYHKI
jgi:hypothetical protein